MATRVRRGGGTSTPRLELFWSSIRSTPVYRKHMSENRHPCRKTLGDQAVPQVGVLRRCLIHHIQDICCVRARRFSRSAHHFHHHANAVHAHIGDVSVDNVVRFGNVIATKGYMDNQRGAAN